MKVDPENCPFCGKKMKTEWINGIEYIRHKCLDDLGKEAVAFTNKLVKGKRG